MSSVLWKPVSSGSWNPGGTSFMLPDRQGGYAGVTIVDASGKEIERLQTKHQAGSGGAWKFFSPRSGGSFGKNIFARVDLGNNVERFYNIPDGSQRLGLNFNSDIPNEPGDMETADMLTVEGGAKYNNPEGGSSGAGGYQPGNIGYGFYPANLEGMFPSVTKVNYDPMKSAPYNFTDPMEFAKKYGEFNRQELQKNFDQAKSMSLEQLNTELQGLQNFAPAASALKRQETSIDNQFNQYQRTQQVNQALPGVQESLASQGNRAEIYARGGVPDSVTDRALELGVRSAAADNASAGGFGATSSVARKTSDLMSAAQRLQIAQYGETLLNQNTQMKAGLFLAPTSYSDAGAQIKTMPEVGAGRLTAQNFSEYNQNTLINPTNALQSKIQQNQYATSLEQQTRMFNTGNEFSANQINAAAANNFALTKFQYQVGFAGAVAGAAQMNSNTQLQLDLAKQYQDIYNASKGDTQASNQIASIISGLGGLVAVGANALSGGGSNTAPNNSGSGTTTTVNPNGGITSPPGSSVNLPATDMGTTRQPEQIVPSNETMNPVGDYSNPTTPNMVTSDSGGSASGGGGAGAGRDVSYIEPYSTSPAVTNFQKDTGLDITKGGSPESTKALVAGSNVVLNNAGLAPNPFPGSVSAGTNNFGQKMYAANSVANNQDVSTGRQIVNGALSVISPMGALTDKDASALSILGDAASSTALIASLTQAYQNGDSKAFVNQILQTVAGTTINQLGKNPDTARAASGMGTALSAYNMFANWGNMSTASKSMAVATTAIQGFNTASGTNLFKTPIIKPVMGGANGTEVITPGLDVGQAVQMLGLGINVYGAIKNWPQMNTLSKIVSGSGVISNMITTANSFGLLGKGVTGAQTLVNGTQLAANGWKLMPTGGVGAITNSNAAAAIPEGMKVVSTGGEGVVAVPSGLESSVPLSVSNPGLSNVVGAAGVVSVGAGAYQVMQGWGEGGAKGRLNGALGGTAMAAGLYAMGGSAMLQGTLFAAASTNPFVLAGVVAASFLSNSIKTGKSTAQTERDSVRGMLGKNGLMNKDYSVTLADGATADIGTDGHGGLHDARNPEMLTEGGGKGRKLNAYEIDYTNDLDYAANMGTTSLVRMLAGGNNKSIDQLGGQLGNAAISKIGYGKDFTEENFNTMSTNVRAMYAKAGIKSKTDAYSVANQMFSDGRIDDMQLVSMHQSFDFLFDANGYAKASSLMAGRQTGIKAASENANAYVPPKNAGEKINTVINGVPFIPYANKETTKANGNINTRMTENVKEKLSLLPASVKESPMLKEMKSKMLSPQKRAELMNLNKTEARKRNRSIYGASLSG